MNHRLLSALVLVVGVVASTANAQPQPPIENEDELIERVVVRNRLYTTGGKLEISPTLGFTILNRLTDHQNLNVGIAYNVSDSIAFELRGGYALSRHTGLADRIAENLLLRQPARELGIVDDMSELWEMQANGALGIRWNPIYGKISLLADLPVHFQTYIWVGGGVGTFFRESIVECLQVEAGRSACAQWAQESRVAPLASVAFGFRFFTHQGGAIRAEVRDYAFTDSYKERIDRQSSEGGGQPTGEPVSSPGFINLVLFDLGYVFFF